MTKLTVNDPKILVTIINYLHDLLTTQSSPTFPSDELTSIEGFVELYQTILDLHHSIQTKEQFELIFNSNPDATIVSRLHDGIITNINDRFIILSGYTREEAIGNSTSQLNLWTTVGERQHFINELHDNGFCHSIEAQLKRKDNSIFIGVISAKIVVLQGIPHIISVTRDITERKHLENELQRLAYTDPLTGANNRGYLVQLLRKEMKRSRRYGQPLAILMFDLDHFKSINDTLGHAAGDEALRAINTVLNSSQLRTSDFWGRIGGEEYAIVLPETTLEQALVVAERIRDNLEKMPITYEKETFFITASIGATEYKKTDTHDSLLNRADQAMYKAKENGRNRVVSLQAIGS